MGKISEEIIKTDVLILGSGGAGLSCLNFLDDSLDVIIVSKEREDEGCTRYAQGGIACVTAPEDSFESHVQDTLYAGDGLCDLEIARMLVENGPEVLKALKDDIIFDSDGSGQYALGHEGAHSNRRILHAGGDATGDAIQMGLLKKAEQRSRWKQLSFHRCFELLVEDGVCYGGRLWDEINKKIIQVHAKSVVIATGGYSQIFQETTNPNTATGDGVSLAFDIGAEIRDPEFTQFHPTALFLAGAPRFLISEAVRGEGAILRNTSGDPFMKSEHELAELAPRDIVSRAIVKEMIRCGESCVFLDLSHLSSDKVYKRFPNIRTFCQKFGIDIGRQWIPVRPAAHYCMGGVKTDQYGSTNIQGLYACGEAASTGVHGANRLASNSLLEALVFGKAVAEHISGNIEAKKFPKFEIQLQEERRDFDIQDIVRTIKSLMWRYGGIFREKEKLEKTRKRLLEWIDLDIKPNLFNFEIWSDYRGVCYSSLLVCSGALEREESRGSHFRNDFPKRDDVNFLKHSVFSKSDLLS